jgi:hypothetical protein
MTTRRNIFLGHYHYLHIIGWWLFWLYEVIVGFLNGNLLEGNSFLQLNLSFLVAVVLTYVIKVWVFDKLWGRYPVWVVFVLSPVFCFAIAYIEFLLYCILYKIVISPGFSIGKMSWQEQLNFALVWVRPIGSWMVVYYIVRLYRAYYQGRMGRLRARVQERKAALMALKKRLNPSFLLGNLQHIAHLVDNDPIAAEQTTLDLSVILRHYLVQHTHTFQHLGQELAVVRVFLAAEQRRLPQPFTYAVQTISGLDKVKCPATLLLSVTEKALELCLQSPATNRQVHINAKVENNDCLVEVVYTSEGPDSPSMEAGAWQGLIEGWGQQLAYLYKGQAAAKLLSPAKGTTGCVFKIPL